MVLLYLWKSEFLFFMVSNFRPKADIPMTSVEKLPSNSSTSKWSLIFKLSSMTLISWSVHSLIWSCASFSLPKVNPGLSFCLIVLHRSPFNKNRLLAMMSTAGSVSKPWSVKYKKSLTIMVLISSGSRIIKNGVVI